MQGKAATKTTYLVSLYAELFIPFKLTPFLYIVNDKRVHLVHNSPKVSDYINASLVDVSS